MAEKPEVGFQFGVEGDKALLSTIQALRNELKLVQSQQQATASSAEVLQRAWRGLVALAATLKIAEFAKDVFNTAVEIGKLSQITGISTQTLSVYYKAATDVGTAHETVDKGLGQLVRSFVLLRAGNAKAAQGFGLLTLHAKDFIGLSTDQKVLKVTNAFATMKDGPEKAAAATALLGKAGRELIPVLDALSGEEFPKLREQCERLGILFTPEMTNAMRRAKQDMEDVKATAEGATAQFEAGLVPALDDVSRAMFTSTTGSGNAFKTLGEYAGNVLKAIVTSYEAIGITISAIALTIVEWVTFEFENLLEKAEAAFRTLGRAAKFDFSGAARAWGEYDRDRERAEKDSSDRISAIWNSSIQQGADKFATIWLGEGRQPLKDPPKGSPGNISGSALGGKNLDKAEASALKQHAQDELTINRDLARQKHEQDKRDCDQGIISLDEYFGRRRAVITNAFVEEIKTLGAEKVGLEDLLTKAEAQGGKTPKQQLANQREILQLKQQIAHIDMEAADEVVKRDTELAKIEDERARAKQEHLLKELEAQKKLADLEGDRVKAAQLAQQIEDLQLRKELEQLGKTKAEIDAFLAQYAAARNIRTNATGSQQEFEAGMSGLSEKKSELQEQVSDYTLQPYQAERRLYELYAQEIPVLEQKVQALRDQAAAAQKLYEQSGGTGQSAAALDLSKQADNDEAKLLRMRADMAKMDTTWMSWRSEAFSAIDQVSTHLTTGLNGWIQGHQRFGDALKQTWNSIVMTGLGAIEKLAAQFIAYHLKMLLVKRITDKEQVASTASSTAQKEGIERASGLKSIFRSARIAAAKAYEALANIPYIGPILGAVAAAATFTAVMALAAFAKGGYVGHGAPAYATLAGGGQIAARSMLGGGYITGPGSSTSDSIPAMLSNQEYVVSARGVSSVGVDVLDAINSGMVQRGAFLPPIRYPAPYSAHGFSAYAGGGIVRNLRPGGSGGEGTTVHQHNTIQSSTIDSKDFRDHIDDHMDYIADELQMRMRNMRWPRR